MMPMVESKGCGGFKVPNKIFRDLIVLNTGIGLSAERYVFKQKSIYIIYNSLIQYLSEIIKLSHNYIITLIYNYIITVITLSHYYNIKITLSQNSQRTAL
uniref:Uncharacterized protein n=1 Tax=Cacopsylla melanoneura TaxID=428564 RepID=A0A8D9DTB5_9HEMI